VYATQQEQTAADIVEQLESFYDIAREFLKLPVPDPKVKVNEFSLGDIDAVISEVRDLREEASTGRKKAYYALKEAMAVPRDFAFVPTDKELPLMGGTVDQDTVVNFALSRRAELVQAAVLVDVTRLEVCAQAKLDRRSNARTFASGTDLHARFIPAPVRNGDYKPGAISPEMPTEVVGSVTDRVDRMTQHLRVHEAAYLKVNGLVELEAVNAFLNWEQAVKKVKDSREAHARAQALVEKARTAAQTKLEPELLVRTESLASKAQAKYVKAVHELVLSLIALEKVTAGGVVPAFKQR
jgi:predicted GIY-YIG superfamily endonuclease